MFVEEELELELDVGGGVVVLLLVVGVVGVVDVWDGSGASARVAVLLDVELGTGGLLEDVGAAAVEEELEGAGAPGASVGRCMSRLAALVPSRWASSAFAAAAAAEVFES